MTLTIPKRLAETFRKTPEQAAWLEQLPTFLDELAERWALKLGEPFDGDEVSVSWVAPVMRAGGTSAVLKVGWLHMEAEHEIQGLRFWDGDPTVRLLEADIKFNAMLLERCVPGTVLRTLPEPEQDVIIAQILRQLWRTPSTPHAFRPLSTMTAHWRSEALADVQPGPDEKLISEGLELFQELPYTASEEVLLATDLHAGNVLRAEREPWLMIDPKPFVGDPAYDATQHLFNCGDRLRKDADGTIRRFTDLLGVDHERVRQWMFARAAVNLHHAQNNPEAISLFRALLL
ncbi:MAG: aminoglycoside phosphotransferase family protein [Chloroflexota bacterium]